MTACLRGCRRGGSVSVQDVAQRVLHASEFYVLGVSSSPPRASLLRRTSERFPSVSVLRGENARVIATFKRCLCAGIVVDMRDAPANNDEQFEEAMHGLRAAVGMQFKRVVVLVASAAGEMQVTRLHRADGSTYYVTRDVALAWKLVAEDRSP
ncbi:MAG: Sulfite reductase flavoprotein alpha-component [Myxococcaceae bacterium]|nr:Sulfite reductase flavoprotein alpha-component [Myxococcaceae bacterium]